MGRGGGYNLNNGKGQKPILIQLKHFPPFYNIAFCQFYTVVHYGIRGGGGGAIWY